MANNRRSSHRRNALVHWQSRAAAEQGRKRNKQHSMERKRRMSDKGRERARLVARPDDLGAALARTRGGGTA
ncbi:hypothetical protein C2E21_9478 [Chlorella sorokiniana]|uniref:Uncharacterized protein n=1 Tax=Chlorella sorokiniana TaxID=3076 RepID=A0A2P6TBC9_CHLSO|nr:hypothetical protein C2E21_9478 [Chlorella sorokiniana]|eukprot:PRW05860.1 hypothetical protein C2E21_9478 [Chlorella sorokiniana]